MNASALSEAFKLSSEDNDDDDDDKNEQKEDQEKRGTLTMMVVVHVQQTGVPTARCTPSHTTLVIAANFKPTTHQLVAAFANTCETQQASKVGFGTYFKFSIGCQFWDQREFEGLTDF